MPQTYSRQPTTCRMKPSADSTGTRPSRWAASTARPASSGSSSHRLSEEDSREWKSHGSPGTIASCHGPNCAARWTTKSSSAARASAAVAGHARGASSPHSSSPMASRSRRTSASMSSSSGSQGRGASRPSRGGRRLASSKFQRPPAGLPPVQHVGEALHAAPLVDRHVTALAQLGGEVAHRAQHQVPALAVMPEPRQARARLDEEHAVGALEGRVAVGELVAEDERRVAHQPLTAR
jgi:hypothetical protein